MTNAGLISTALRGGVGGLGHSPQAPAMPIPIDGCAGDAANAGLLREKACWQSSGGSSGHRSAPYPTANGTCSRGSGKPSESNNWVNNRLISWQRMGGSSPIVISNLSSTIGRL